MGVGHHRGPRTEPGDGVDLFVPGQRLAAGAARGRAGRRQGGGHPPGADRRRGHVEGHGILPRARHWLERQAAARHAHGTGGGVGPRNPPGGPRQRRRRHGPIGNLGTDCRPAARVDHRRGGRTGHRGGPARHPSLGFAAGGFDHFAAARPGRRQRPPCSLHGDGPRYARRRERRERGRRDQRRRPGRRRNGHYRAVRGRPPPPPRLPLGRREDDRPRHARRPQQQRRPRSTAAARSSAGRTRNPPASPTPSSTTTAA